MGPRQSALSNMLRGSRTGYPTPMEEQIAADVLDPDDGTVEAFRDLMREQVKLTRALIAQRQTTFYEVGNVPLTSTICEVAQKTNAPVFINSVIAFSTAATAELFLAPNDGIGFPIPAGVTILSAIGKLPYAPGIRPLLRCVAGSRMGLWVIGEVAPADGVL